MLRIIDKSTDSDSKETKEQKLSVELQQEIKAFDKTKLNKQKVYFVSSSINFAPVHGFPVIAGVPRKVARLPEKKGKEKIESEESLVHRLNQGYEYAQVYYCGASIMHAHFHVTSRIVSAVNTNTKFTVETKKAVTLLEHHVFPSVEHFLRAVLYNAHPSKTAKEIFEEAANPNAELQELVSLNEKMNFERGAILPTQSNTGRRARDRDLFEKKSRHQTSKVYEKIDPMVLRDVFDQQKLYQFYLDEKAGIGKSVEYQSKLRALDEQKTYKIISGLVDYSLIPSEENERETNCNKTSATLLQMAETISAEKQKRKPDEITGASRFAMGASQRMYLWDPLQRKKPRQLKINGKAGFVIGGVIGFFIGGGPLGFIVGAILGAAFELAVNSLYLKCIKIKKNIIKHSVIKTSQSPSIGSYKKMLPELKSEYTPIADTKEIIADTKEIDDCKMDTKPHTPIENDRNHKNYSVSQKNSTKKPAF